MRHDSGRTTLVPGGEGEAGLLATTPDPYVRAAEAGHRRHAARGRPGGPGRLGRDPRLLLRAQPHGGERRRSARQRAPSDLPRGRARDRLGGWRAVGGAPQRRARERRQLDLYLGPLAHDPQRCDRSLPLPTQALLPPARRDDRLRPDRLLPLCAVPRRAASPARRRAGRHGHAALRRLPRAPAAGPDESVRGAAEPARRLEPPRRDRAPDRRDEPRAAPRGRLAADCDVARGRGHGEPLRDRRPRRHRRRARRARDRDFPPGAPRRIYTASR